MAKITQNNVFDRANRETRLQAAIQAYSGQNRPSIAAVARQFDVPRETLSKRLRGQKSRSQPRPSNARLTKAEELGIIIYCQRMEEIGIFVRRRQLTTLAEGMLEQRPNPPPTSTVSGMWPRRFLARYPELQNQKARSLEVLRGAAHDPTLISQWFKRFEELYTELNIQKEDLWNFDETGFILGKGNAQNVIISTRNKRSQAFIQSTTSRDYATCTEAISAGGGSIPPFIIFKAQNFLQKWYEIDLQQGTAITVSDSGYINDALALQWIQHFAFYSAKQQRGKWRLLLCDSFDAHYTKEFLQTCEDNRIKVFNFPSHSTHILQPLDVVAFTEFKRQYGLAVDEASMTGCIDFNKLEFLAALKAIRRRVFCPANIYASFRKSGIHPINAELVLKPLRKKWYKAQDTEYTKEEFIIRASSEEEASASREESMAEDEDSEDGIITQADFIALPSSSPPVFSQPQQQWSTPRTVRSQAHHTDTLQQRLTSRYDLSSPTRDCFNSYTKGARAIALSTNRAWNTIQNTEAATKARNARKQMNNKRLNPKPGGVITVEEGREMARTRAEEEEAKYQARLERDRIKAERQRLTDLEEEEKSIRSEDRKIQRLERLLYKEEARIQRERITRQKEEDKANKARITLQKKKEKERLAQQKKKAKEAKAQSKPRRSQRGVIQRKRQRGIQRKFILPTEQQ
jgi:hypothetical protein